MTFQFACQWICLFCCRHSHCHCRYTAAVVGGAATSIASDFAREPRHCHSLRPERLHSCHTHKCFNISRNNCIHEMRQHWFKLMLYHDSPDSWLVTIKRKHFPNLPPPKNCKLNAYNWNRVRIQLRRIDAARRARVNCRILVVISRKFSHLASKCGWTWARYYFTDCSSRIDSRKVNSMRSDADAACLQLHFRQTAFRHFRFSMLKIVCAHCV